MALPLAHSRSYCRFLQGQATQAFVPIIDPKRIEPANLNLPFLMLKLSDVCVTSGALFGERLFDLTDLVNGDRMSFKSLKKSTPADLVDHAGQSGIVFASANTVPSDGFIVEQKVDLTFMSDQGHCVHAHAVQPRDRSFGAVLLLPATCKAAMTYELIAQSRERDRHDALPAYRSIPQKMEEISG